MDNVHWPDSVHTAAVIRKSEGDSLGELGDDLWLSKENMLFLVFFMVLPVVFSNSLLVVLVTMTPLEGSSKLSL